MRTRRRPMLALVLLLLGVGILTACGGGVERVDTPPSTPAATTGPSTDPTGSTAPRVLATVAPDAAGVTVRVYFLDDDRLATGHRRVAPTTAVAGAALEQLTAGPTAQERSLGYTTVIRPDARVAVSSIADGTATLVIDPPIGRGYNDVTARRALAQVVYTVTQFPTVERVRIGSDPTTYTRADLTDVLPSVLLESVAPGDVVTSPVTVAGTANTFEATVRIRITGADGRILADTFTTATAGTGTWGTFSERVAFDRGTNTTGTVAVFWDSPKDGSPQDVVEVPVRFS